MIKIKKLLKIICLFSIILIFGGCYDYNELNSLDIIGGIGITYKDDKYKGIADNLFINGIIDEKEYTSFINKKEKNNDDYEK